MHLTYFSLPKDMGKHKSYFSKNNKQKLKQNFENNY